MHFPKEYSQGSENIEEGKYPKYIFGPVQYLHNILKKKNMETNSMEMDGWQTKSSVGECSTGPMHT